MVTRPAPKIIEETTVVNRGKHVPYARVPGTRYMTIRRDVCVQGFALPQSGSSVSYGWAILRIGPKYKHMYDTNTYINTRRDGQKGRQPRKKAESIQMLIDACVDKDKDN